MHSRWLQAPESTLHRMFPQRTLTQHGKRVARGPQHLDTCTPNTPQPDLACCLLEATSLAWKRWNFDPLQQTPHSPDPNSASPPDLDCRKRQASDFQKLVQFLHTHTQRGKTASPGLKLAETDIPQHPTEVRMLYLFEPLHPFDTRRYQEPTCRSMCTRWRLDRRPGIASARNCPSSM